MANLTRTERLILAQQDFFFLVGELIAEIKRRGKWATFSRVACEEDCPIGHPKSLHKIRLAADINLFDPRQDNGKPGTWLEGTEAHREFGEWWEALDPRCAWGGRFGGRDGNHYSLRFEGMR